MKNCIFFLAVLFCVASPASVSSQNIIQLGPNYYSAGVPSADFEFYAVDRQRSQNWCWAACIQMVLNYHGLYVTQEDIVTRCYGSLVDRPGGALQMFTALNGWAYNVYGGISYIYTNDYPTNAAEIQGMLANNWPMIVGLNTGGPVGHAYVLTAIYYSYTYDNWGNINGVYPDKVVLRDPWPFNPSRVEMSWTEFAMRVNSCFKVWVTYQ